MVKAKVKGERGRWCSANGVGRDSVPSCHGGGNDECGGMLYFCVYEFYAQRNALSGTSDSHSHVINTSYHWLWRGERVARTLGIFILELLIWGKEVGCQDLLA